MMLTASTIREKASLLRKNAEFIDRLATAKSVELYDQLWQSNSVHEVGYYTLVGTDGDLNRVIPFPILVEVLGVSEEALLDHLTSFPVRMAWKEQRGCFFGWHPRAEEHTRHGKECVCVKSDTAYFTDCSSKEQEGCMRAMYCPACEKHWEFGEEPPKVPFKFMTGFGQTFVVGDHEAVCKELFIAEAS